MMEIVSLLVVSSAKETTKAWSYRNASVKFSTFAAAQSLDLVRGRRSDHYVRHHTTSEFGLRSQLTTLDAIAI